MGVNSLRLQLNVRMWTRLLELSARDRVSPSDWLRGAIESDLGAVTIPDRLQAPRRGDPSMGELLDGLPGHRRS